MHYFMITDSIKTVLQSYTSYTFISLTPRANASIKRALEFAKKRQYTTVHIPDEGGWMLYEPFARKLGFTVVKIPTQNGIIDPNTLNLNSESVLLLHSLAGYHSKQPCEQLRTVCDSQQALFIEDMCGIVYQKGHGHILLGSFGKAKPINYGTGGFIATQDASWFEELRFDTEIEDALLLEKVKHVKKRVQHLFHIRDTCAKALKNEGFTPIYDEYGLVLIVEYATDAQKEQLKEIAQKHTIDIEYCPRYIRSLKKALSFEIKRKD